MPYCSARSADRSGPIQTPRCGPNKACSACERRSTCSPTCGRSRCTRPCSTRRRSRPKSLQGHGHHGRARTHRRHLLRREASHGRHRHATCAPTAWMKFSASRASPAGSHAVGANPSSPSTRRTCSRLRACGVPRSRSCCAANFPMCSLEHMLVDSAAMHLIRKPASFDVLAHREHVRRHPHRRSFDARRLARLVAVGFRWAPASSACTNRFTVRRRTSPARASRIRTRPSSA